MFVFVFISFQKTRRIKSKTPGRKSLRYSRIISLQANKNKNKRKEWVFSVHFQTQALGAVQKSDRTKERRIERAA